MTTDDSCSPDWKELRRRCALALRRRGWRQPEIAEALRKHNGNSSRAARELGLTRCGFYLKLGRHDLSATG